MVTYSDMVTLLLTFFILMLSMANMDKIKFFQAMGSLRGAFGVFDSKKQEVMPWEFLKLLPITDERVQRVYKRVESKLQDLNLNKDIKLVKNRGAVVLRINDTILFDSGSAKLRQKAYPVLRKVAKLIKPLPFDLRIEGHTDDRKIKRKGYTNWDLSVDRAVSVLKFFVSNDLVAVDRLSAAGYGAQRPIVPNDTKKHRAMNRRVDLVLEKNTGYRENLPYLIDTKNLFPF